MPYAPVTEPLLRPTAGKALGECIQMVAERRGVPEAEVGYEDVARAAFGRAGQVAVSVSMYTELYGICAVLFIVMVRDLAANAKCKRRSHAVTGASNRRAMCVRGWACKSLFSVGMSRLHMPSIWNR